MISRVFIERPRLAGVISIVLTLAGILSIFSLPITQYPQVTPPQVVVSAMYPGANADVLASTVAGPIEDAVNGVEDMIYMSSTSSNSGRYELMVSLPWVRIRTWLGSRSRTVWPRPSRCCPAR